MPARKWVYVGVILIAIAFVTVVGLWTLKQSTPAGNSSKSEREVATVSDSNPPAASGFHCFCECNNQPERDLGCIQGEGQECSPACFPPSECRGELRPDDNCPPITPRPTHPPGTPRDDCRDPDLKPAAFPDHAPTTTGRFLIKSRGTDNGGEICIEVRRDDQGDGGKFQQQDCRNNGQTAFTFIPHPESHTYSIQTFAGRFAAQTPERGGEPLGLGADQIPATCIVEARWVLVAAGGTGNAFRIVNQKSEDCLRVGTTGPSHIGREDLIGVDRCENNDFDAWFLVPIR